MATYRFRRRRDGWFLVSRGSVVWRVHPDRVWRLAVALNERGHKLVGIKPFLDEWELLEAEAQWRQFVSDLRSVADYVQTVDPSLWTSTHRALSHVWHPDRDGSGFLQGALNRVNNDHLLRERTAA